MTIYWLHSPHQRERWRVHILPRRRMFAPGMVPGEDRLQDAEALPPREFVDYMVYGLRRLAM